MGKKTKHQITLKEAIDRIPHDQCYCNDSGKCPFNSMRKFTKSKYKRLIQEETGRYKVITQYRKPYLEWCSFLRQPLYIQDGCKDCGINCDLPLEKIEEEIKDHKDYHDLYEPDEPFEPYTVEQVLEFYGEEKPYIRRIKCREYVDMYKEMFPDEIELIDKIVEEDNLTYWREENKNVD